MTEIARRHSLIWTLIYGGLAVIGIGIALDRQGVGYGWGVIVTGGLLAGVGAVLIWMRSRLPDPAAPEPSPDASTGDPSP